MVESGKGDNLELASWALLAAAILAAA